MRLVMWFWALVLWFGLTATTATAGVAFECDGNHTRIAYDAPTFSSFNYDSDTVPLAHGESERGQRISVHIAQFAKFLAAEGGTMATREGLIGFRSI